MCNYASFVITKSGKAYWSKKGPSHEIIIEEYGLKHLDTLSGVQLVRVEFVPPGGNDFLAPLDKWSFYVDQDIYPEWWNHEWGRDIVENEMPKWFESNVVLHGHLVDTLDYRIAANYGHIGKVDVGGGVVYNFGKITEMDCVVDYNYGEIGHIGDHGNVGNVLGFVETSSATSYIGIVDGRGHVESAHGHIEELFGTVVNVARDAKIIVARPGSRIYFLSGRVDRAYMSYISTVKYDGVIEVADSCMIGVVNGKVMRIEKSFILNVGETGEVYQADDSFIRECVGKVYDQKGCVILD